MFSRSPIVTTGTGESEPDRFTGTGFNVAGLSIGTRKFGEKSFDPFKSFIERPHFVGKCQDLFNGSR